MRLPLCLPTGAVCRITTLLVVSFLLTSCETPTVEPDIYAWRNTDNGIQVWAKPKSYPQNRLTWNGPVNKGNQADGFGKLEYYNPYVSGDLFTGGYNEQTVSMEGKMVAGKFEGEVIHRFSNDGRTVRDQYSQGEWVSGKVLQAGYSSSSGSSSGLSDGQLVGGMLGLAGIAGGDAGLAGAGLTMASGNESAGLSQMTEWATSTPGGSEAVAGASTSAGTSAKRNLPGLRHLPKER